MSHFQPKHVSKVTNRATVATLVPDFPLVRDTLNSGELLEVPATFQLIVAAKLTNSGTIANSGRVHVL